MNISSNDNPYRQYVAAYKENQKSDEATDSDEDSPTVDAVKDFACGMLGLDSAADDAREEASDNGDGLFYNVGQVVKAAGSVASMISFFV